jgi:hypothetical protein
VACAVVALAAAVPASAAAQRQVAPPDGDNYLFPLAFSDFDHPAPFPSEEVGFIANTSTYTVQSDMYSPPNSGGPVEPTVCGRSEFGNTIWSYLHVDRYGVMHISTAGNFDSVIAVIPFKSPNNAAPQLNRAFCSDRLGGFSEEAPFLAAPGWYAVSVGGTGATMGGQVEGKFLLGPPPSVDGQAFLFWKTGPLRVTDLHVKGVPGGETLSLSCTKGACKKRRVTVKSKRAAGQLLKVNGKPVGRGPAALKPLVREAAKSVKLLKNKKVKKGAKIELRITQPGYIGKYYRWDVKKNAISSATSRCLNPGSNKPHKKCHG